MKCDEKGLTLVLALALSFLIQMIVGINGIIVPLFAKHMGAKPLLLGLIGAAGGLIYTFMPLIAGMLSDRFRRKTFIVVSMLLYGLSCIFYAMAANPQILIPIRALEWCSISLFWPSVEALLAEVSGKNIDRTLEKFNLSWGSATVVAPMIGGLLVTALGAESRIPFISLAIILFTLSFLSILAIREVRDVKLSRGKYKGAERRGASDPVRNAIIVILLFSTIGGIIFNLFPAYAVDLGILASEVGLIMLFNGLFRLIAFLQAYRIERKIGEKRTLLLGAAVMAISLILTAFDGTTLILSVALSMIGFSAGVLYAESISIMLGKSGHARGYAAGLFESLIGVGYFLGSLVGGAAAEYSPNAPYILGFLLSSAVFLMLLSQKLIKRY